MDPRVTFRLIVAVGLFSCAISCCPATHTSSAARHPIVLAEASGLKLRVVQDNIHTPGIWILTELKNSSSRPIRLSITEPLLENKIAIRDNTNRDVRPTSAGRDLMSPARASEFGELFPKPVDGRDRLSGDVSFSVDEHDAVDQVLQSFAAVQLPPA